MKHLVGNVITIRHDAKEIMRQTEEDGYRGPYWANDMDGLEGSTATIARMGNHRGKPVVWMVDSREDHTDREWVFPLEAVLFPSGIKLNAR